MSQSIKRIDYSKEFLKQLKKSPPEVKTAFAKRFEQFIEDPFHALLNNHSLTGEYTGKRSINITGNWRAIFSEQVEEDGKAVQLHLIGTHLQLYRKF